MREHVGVLAASPGLGEPEVAQLQGGRLLRVQQGVVELEVPVRDAVAVAILHRLDKLPEEVPGLVLGQEQPGVLRVLPALGDVAREGPSLGVLHHEPEVLFRQ